jgi:NADP-dependent 3-hydroxy acid dehydrogenase YdfG
MSTATTAVPIRREPELLGQTVVVIGGSAGIGLETARRARAEGARLILAGRNPERLQQVARELDTQSTVAFDATTLTASRSSSTNWPLPRALLRAAGRVPF